MNRLAVRIACVTACISVVTSIAVTGPRSDVGADEVPTPESDLRLAGRSEAPPAERIAAARRLLETVVPDAEAGVRAAAMILADDALTAAALLRKSLDADVIPADTLALARASVRAALAKEVDPVRLAALATFALATGLRGDEFAPALGRSDAPGVGAAFAADHFKAPSDVANLWVAWGVHRTAADRLDRASADDPKAARVAIDELVDDAPHSFDFLLSVARRSETRTPPGRLPRRVRAIVTLGMIGDRRAVDELVPCIVDLNDEGWVRAAAVTALGDIGDPRVIPDLCRVLFYTGDLHRPRDSWDYPGVDNTDVPADRWDTVEYYAIDCAAADALLRLGVGNAAEWLIRERLHPRSGRWRIRVLQDAVDAIRRAFPAAPTGEFEPDAGLPQRAAAYQKLIAWSKTGPRLAHRVSERDERFQQAAKRIVDTIGGKGVMELQIVKRAATLVGSAMVPTMLDSLARSKSKIQRAEMALVLGTLGDRRVVDPLLALTADPVPAVRGNAMQALARFVGAEADPRLLGDAKDATNRIVARAIELLADPEAAPRTTALQSLAHAHPRDDVRAAVVAHASVTHPENDFGDYRNTELVVNLIQSGEGVEAVLERLRDKNLFVRRYMFELLRSAFDLEPDVFDPSHAPDAPAYRPFDANVLQRALEERRR